MTGMSLVSLGQRLPTSTPRTTQAASPTPQARGLARRDGDRLLEQRVVDNPKGTGGVRQEKHLGRQPAVVDHLRR